jgi:hypothetical protein
MNGLDNLSISGITRKVKYSQYSRAYIIKRKKAKNTLLPVVRYPTNKQNIETNAIHNLILE